MDHKYKFQSFEMETGFFPFHVREFCFVFHKSECVDVGACLELNPPYIS